MNKGIWMPSVTMFLCPGREWAARDWAQQPWAPKWKGANIFLWQGKQTRQYKDWMTPWNKRENKVKPGKKKKGTRSKRDERDMTDTNTQSKTPKRLLVSSEAEHMEKKKNLLLPQLECLHNCHFQFYIIPFSTRLFRV